MEAYFQKGSNSYGDRFWIDFPGELKTPDKLEHAKSDAIIMHPGPMNRGIEIDTILADDINKDQELKQGDRIGMIRFGSRADIYYENYEPLVKVGQKAISGETLLAKK